MTYQINDYININLDAVITSNGSILTAWSGGQVTAITEKAVQLTATTERGKVITCWFPKSALKMFGEGRSNPFDNHLSYCCTLARWFKLNDWARTFINLSRDSQTLAA